MLERLVDQANKELASSNYYLSFSLWFADQELPGSAVSCSEGVRERVKVDLLTLVRCYVTSSAPGDRFSSDDFFSSNRPGAVLMRPRKGSTR